MAHYIYSIRKNATDCPLTQGYVGCTNNASKRHHEHFHANAGNPSPLRGEIKDEWFFEVLAVCEDKTNALQVEYFYRPTPNIGLNVRAGGSHGGNTWLKGRKSNNPTISVEAKEFIEWWYNNPRLAPTLTEQAVILECSVSTISKYRSTL